MVLLRLRKSTGSTCNLCVGSHSPCGHLLPNEEGHLLIGLTYAQSVHEEVQTGPHGTVREGD
eukprot:5068389-Alexandrium_andersonii.AAC.1